MVSRDVQVSVLLLVIGLLVIGSVGWSVYSEWMSVSRDVAIVHGAARSGPRPVVRAYTSEGPSTNWLIEDLSDRRITVTRSAPADLILCLPSASGPDVCDLVQNWTRDR